MTLFGAWLVQRQRVTAEQVLVALDLQERQRPPIHEIAMHQRLLSAMQVLQVLDEQRKTRQCFETAVQSLGLLTRAQIDTLRIEQAKHGPKIGQVLVQTGALSPSQLERELEEFYESTNPSRDDPPRKATPGRGFRKAV